MADNNRNYWGEDSEYPLEDWRYEVANNYTRLGYWEWVEHRRESNKEIEETA